MIRHHRRLLTTGCAAGCAAALVGAALTAAPAQAAKPSPATTATGTVFMVNPVQSSGDESLTDGKDSAAAVPDSAYATVTLHDLDGSGYLRGTWANVVSSTGPAAYSPTGTFTYRRDDDRFEQVMAYYWVTEAQRYLQSLGFGSTLRPVNAESQDVRTDQWGVDNSYSTDKKDFLRFGKGGVDDAEDGEVVLHEYGHAVHDAQVPGFGSSLEAGSIGEAWGDYLAVTVAEAVRTANGWPRRTDLPCVADWDSTSYTSTVPHCLRRVDGTKVYPTDVRGEVHADGEIWSSALWHIRTGYQAIGLDSRRADTTIVDAQFDFAPDTSFSAAAKATYAKSLARDGAKAAAVVKQAFADRGITW